ncbi:hypothetical protein MZO42_04605 [Sphingomonas psychrotolerans]|uniref:Uncharacterized protein n=1 Tax=Sphingomonas psychrotolerans TaxID=1327635 RepID=A0ABU3N3V6_9SPHN|nr:hypothetical protein [Sphingomonas psychrotolerans]MDT8757970.1 hypothetical protein [Sphingomonas psychrotolerans]
MKTGMAAMAWLALSATGAQAAADTAQKPCLTPVEAQALIIALMPPAVRAVGGACNSALPSVAYLRTNADRLGQRYTAPAIAAKPAAASALGKISGTGDKITPDTFDTFANMLVGELVTKGIKPDVCAKVDRVAALLDPLPPANLAGFVAAILEFTSEDSKRGPDLNICKA